MTFFRINAWHTKRNTPKKMCYWRFLACCCQFIFLGIVMGCSLLNKKLLIKDMSASFNENTIISSKRLAPVSFEALMADLETTRLIYVGERHTNPAHHEIQLKILSALYDKNPKLIVGMEVFDQTYQPVLNQWSAGKLNQKEFLEKVHWYANWTVSYELYAGLLDYIKQHHIPIVALNVPSDIPSKIAVGGIDNLSDEDKQYLPKTLNMTNNAHKEYIKKVFHHHHVKGRDNFDYFYAAQCVWEDVMADIISKHLKDNVMLVMVGNGHIIKKFGIPNRAHALTNASFKTIMPMDTGNQIEIEVADYIWVSSPLTD